MTGRGLAPIAATLILVAITVIAALITYLWVSSYPGMIS
ncbi:MAG: archaellin/type IV pilin N-terminal domain-containing protein [Thermofilaceae archaeon]